MQANAIRKREIDDFNGCVRRAFLQLAVPFIIVAAVSAIGAMLRPGISIPVSLVLVAIIVYLLTLRRTSIIPKTVSRLNQLSVNSDHLPALSVRSASSRSGRSVFKESQQNSSLPNGILELGLEQGRSILELALHAHETRAEERRVDEDMFGWAAAEDGIGVTLSDLGWITNDAGVLAKAVKHLRVAARAWKELQEQIKCAESRDHLGRALVRLAIQTEQDSLLKEAIDEYRSALRTRTREYFPIEWAETQDHLATALTRLGIEHRDIGMLAEAERLYELAIRERPKNVVPFLWADSHNNKGVALHARGDLLFDLYRRGVRKDDTKNLGYGRLLRSFEDAIDAFREALRIYTREGEPQHWAMVLHNLGNALAKLGTITGDASYVEASVVAFRTALLNRRFELDAKNWAVTQIGLAYAQANYGILLAELPYDLYRYDLYDAAHQELTDAEASFLTVLTKPKGVVHRDLFALAERGIILTKKYMAHLQEKRDGPPGPNRPPDQRRRDLTDELGTLHSSGGRLAGSTA